MKKTPAPYPNLGEIIRLISIGVDTKRNNKKVDQYARGGDFDCSLKPRMIQEVVFTPIKQLTNEDYALSLCEQLDRFLEDYIELVKAVPMDGMNRDEALRVLNRNYFAPAAADFIQYFIEMAQGPSPLFLFSSRENAVDVVFQWIEKNWGQLLDHVSAPHKDLIRNWRKGENLPSFENMRQFSTWINETLPINKRETAISENDMNRVKFILILARAIEKIKRLKHGKSGIDAIREYIWGKAVEPDIGLIISSAQIEICKKYYPLSGKALLLENELRLNKEKTPSAKKALKRELEIVRKICKRKDPAGLTSYFIDWMDGRWQVFAGNYKKALQSYKKALEGVLYRGGANQEQIIKECLVLAAAMKNRPFLKRLKHQMIAFSLFRDNAEWEHSEIANRVSRSKDAVVEDWEVAQWAGHFDRVFPERGYFHSRSENAKEFLIGPLLVDVNNIPEPDLRNPNRTIKIGEFKKKKMPQLIWYIQLNQTEDVRKLLNEGASVDVFSQSGESPILMAIEHLNPKNTGVSMDSACFDLISSKEHKKETINSLTVKRRLTPLISAVETANSHIVQRLVEMGAEVDLRGTTDNVTPLYHCLQRIIICREPAKFDQIMLAHQTNPGSQMMETIRRNADGMMGIDLNDVQRSFKSPKTERQSEIFKEENQYFRFRVCKREFITPLIDIAGILVKKGADVNAEQTLYNNLKGVTPLMLAAEMDEIDLFKIMLEHGGDPEKYYLFHGRKVNCWDIAEYFHADRVRSFL